MAWGKAEPETDLAYVPRSIGMGTGSPLGLSRPLRAVALVADSVRRQLGSERCDRPARRASKACSW